MLRELIVLPLAGAIIGWITNVLAIRMIFRPREPKRFIGLTIQGVLPKRKLEFAQSMGKAIESQLLPVDELIGQLETGGYREEIVSTVVSHVDRRVQENLPGFLPGNLRAVLGKYLKEVVQREARLLVDKMSIRLKATVRERVRVADLVERRVVNLDLMQLEELLLVVAGREFRAIELLGALLGFLLGLVQVGLLSLLRIGT